MSASVPSECVAESSRPTRPGRRRRPRSRTLELRRPPVVYRAALEMAFARLSVIDRLRDEGFASAPTDE